jgi:hypothetical protein
MTGTTRCRKLPFLLGNAHVCVAVDSAGKPPMSFTAKDNNLAACG